MTDGSDTHRDEYLKSGNRKLQSEALEQSSRKPGELFLAEHVAVSEFLSKIPERRGF